MRYSFANGHDDAVRSVDSIIADRLQATSRSHGMRQDVARYMVRLIDGCFGDRSRASRTFLHGSVPLRTYLPDSDLDLCVMVPPHRAAEWSKRVIEKLMPLALAQRQKTRTPPHGAHGDRKEERSFNVNDVRFINAAVPLVTCAVNGLTVDISAGHPNAVRAVALFEQVDRLVGRDHLFKRSVLLIKAFCRKQALMPRANRGGLSTYALNVMIASVFNVGEEEIEHPLQALRLFLREFSRFDWERDYLAIDGTHVIEDPAAPLVGGAGHGRPPRLALQLSPTRRVSSIASNATRVADPSMWPCHIADPLEPSNDLGRSCTMEVFQRVQRVLKKNHELLHAALLTATRPDESKSLIEALLSGVSKAYPPYWADVGGNGRGRGGSRSAKSKSRRRKGRGGRGGNGNSNGAAGGTPLQASAPTFSPAVNLECEWQALSDDAARAASLVDSGGGGSPLRSASPPSRSRQGSSDSPPPSLLGSVAASSLSPPSRSPLPSPASSPPSSPNKLVAGAASFRQRYGWVVQGLLWAGLYLLVLTTTRGGGSARGANGSSAVSSVRDNGGVELQNSRSGDTVAARRALQEQKQKQEEREQSKERRRQQLPRSGGAPPQALAPPVPLICHPIYGEIAAKDYPVYARAMPAAAQVVPVGSMIAFDGSENAIAACYTGSRVFQWFRAAASSGDRECSGGAGRCDAGIALKPARSQSVMLPAVDVEDSGEYWCTLDTIVISRVVLRVLGPPQVSNTFRHVTAKIGEKLSFSAEIPPQRGPQSFQWQRNGLAIPGATNREFKLKSVARRHEGTYHCEVQNMMATSMWGEIVISIEKEKEKPKEESLVTSASDSSARQSDFVVI